MEQFNFKRKRFLAFSLAEAIITLLIVSLITLAAIPVITKKHRDRNHEKHGAFACYWSGNTLVGKYLINGEKTNAKTTYDEKEKRHGCIFDPPVGAKNFVVTAVGGGGGGARGYYEDKQHIAIGESSGSFQVPVDGEYRVLLIAAGGAGGHTSGGEVGHKYGSSQPPAVSGTPGGMIVSNKIQLKEKGNINYTLGVQGWAREDNDGYPQHGQDASVSYKASNGDSFDLAAQGGGGGASMNYEGSDDSRFYYCKPANSGTCKEDYRGMNPNRRCRASKVAADNCDGYMNNGFYKRFSGYVDGNDESHPYLRSAHAGGVRVSTGGTINSSSFAKYVMKSMNGIAKIYEYEKPLYAYRYSSSGAKGQVAGWGQDSQARPYWNISLTPDMMKTFKIWSQIDQDHPFGSGGYGTGGGWRNHKAPGGHGGPAAFSIIWTQAYSGLAGKPGNVLQIPFAQMNNKTLAFPGLGGKGSYYGPFCVFNMNTGTNQCSYQTLTSQNGEASYIKNHASASGGDGADIISPGSKDTYKDSHAGGKVIGQDGRLANITTKANATMGGAGGLSQIASNGYINNNSLYGLTRQIFANGQDIALFTALLGAGSGGGGGAANADTKAVGNGGNGQSGIIFIQW